MNSDSLDGEPAIHPDGVTLYFASNRSGNRDPWSSRWDGNAWSNPVALPGPINTVAEEPQPAFPADGDTLCFVSTRNLIGSAIHRSAWDSTTSRWGTPELVIGGIVGEPTLTADGQHLYFVHLLSDARGNYDADVWHCERRR